MSITSTPPPDDVLATLGLHPSGPQPEASIAFGRRLRSWLVVRWRSVAVLTGTLAVVGVVHAWGMSGSPAVTDDEGTYVAQAWAVQVEHRLAHYTYWYDHPPLGWLQIALWTWLTDGFHRVAHAVIAGREVALIAVLVAAALVFLICRRLGLSRPWSVVAVGLCTLSPLALEYQRLALLDNLAVPWLLAAVALALSPRRSLPAAAGAGACLAVAVLTKETFLLFAPAVVVLLWTRCHRRTRAFCLTAFGTVWGLIVVAYPLYALLKGELFPGRGHVSLIDALKFQLFSRPSSGSVLAAHTPAHNTAATWLRLDWILLAAGAAACIAALAVPKLRPIALAFALPALLVLRGGYLPDPYVIGLLPFAAILVAGVLDAAGGTRMVRRGLVATAAAVLLVVVVPPWLHGDRALADTHANTPVWAAEAWLESHADRHARIIADDSVWVDLVRHGFSPHLGVVWFYKLDFTNNLDPSVSRALPGGWRDFQYVVSTPIIRSALQQLPGGLMPVRQALAQSAPVARFGSGNGWVEIRRITVQAPPAAAPAAHLSGPGPGGAPLT